VESLIALRFRLRFYCLVLAAQPLFVVGMPIVAPSRAQIMPGHGIASIGIGDSARRVRHVFGPPRQVKPPAWGFGPPLAGQVAFGHHRHVFDIWTTSRYQRTKRGIGPGDSRKSMGRAYPHARCHRVASRAICQLMVHQRHKTVKTEFLFKADVLRRVEVYLVPPSRGSPVKK
jgi:hypothetical protein